MGREPRSSAAPQGAADDGARTYTVRDEADRFWAAREAARVARAAGFSPRAQSEIAVAVAELVSNAVRHAAGGTLRLRPVHGARRGIEVVVADQGAGLGDPERAFTDGVSRGHTLRPDAPKVPGQGLGVGFGTVRRMMAEVEVRVAPGGGTVVTARRWT